MVFVMPQLKRSKSGAYIARKGIPRDVREDYQRLYGPAWEALFHVSASTPLVQAKILFKDWLNEIETRIATIRAARNGEGRPLSLRQAHALAGEWYRWYVARYENEPGKALRWWWLETNYLDDLKDLAPDPFKEHEEQDPAWGWMDDPEARAGVRALVADAAQTAQFLASKGVTLTNEARGLFLDALEKEFLPAVQLLMRRAEGDYTPDKRLERFPVLALESTSNSSGDTPLRLFERWIISSKPKDSTINRWRAVFLHLNFHFPDRTAASITSTDAKSWIDGLITVDRSARTVSDTWLGAARTVFGWAVKQALLKNNPFTGVTVTVPRKPVLRDTKAFTAEEARTILKASLEFTDTSNAFAAARRWVPWLCAYSGARAGEITQLRGKDVLEREGIRAFRITPEAGTVKTDEARVVPLHEHLIEQEFLAFVESKGEGPLFYNPGKEERAAELTNPKRPRAVKTRERLAGWVRSLGLTDAELQPNHAWRHTFKQIADRHGVSNRVSDQITGHKPPTVGQAYGAPTLEDMAAALRRFPRYKTD
jgi:integrase